MAKRPPPPSEWRVGVKLLRLDHGGWAVRTADGLFALRSPWTELGSSQPELGERLPDDVATAAPVAPTKIVCVGLNYAQHAAEMNKQIPEEPLLFMKPSTSLIGPHDPICLPRQSTEVHHEGELAIVIGRRLQGADEAEAQRGIFGYTCANDVTARDIQRREQRYTRAKGFDSFCPIGPCVVLAQDFVPADHHVELRVNGVVRQRSSLDDFIFQIPHVVSFISSIMTLLPGDVILTGTPSGVGPIVAGDVVEVEIDGIGVLENPVV